MSLQPLKLWGHWGAPNPFKVCIILEELQLPYEISELEFTEVKSEAYTKINPNGRLPSLQDPNTGITLWESGAIVQYLIDQYDKDHKISCETIPEKYLTQQWLAFQISGQGPYVGQAAWFTRFHPEKLPSAIERYMDETLRIAGVKCTYADLAFVTWAAVADGLLKQVGKFAGFEGKYPAYTKWLQNMDQRGSVSQIRAMQVKGRADHGLPP